MTGQLTEPQSEQEPQQDTNRSGLTIEHTDDEGTTIDGTSRGDGTVQVLKANGWRWSRTLGAWYVPRSRNVPPKRGTIARTVEALKAAGFAVAVSIDATPADREAVEARRVQDAAARADRLDERAQRHEQVAADRYAAARGIADGIPLGQPILVGHHSEGRARRDAARMGAHMDASVAHTEAAEEARRAARIAAAATDARNKPVTVANRVDRLTAEVRRAERQLAAIERGREALEARQRARGEAAGGDGQRDGHEGGGAPQEAAEGAAEGERVAQQLRTAEAHAVRVRERLESDRADLAHWQAVRARQVADGTATDFGRHNVAAGDRVRVRDVWYPVVRANAKTVTVFGYLLTSPTATARPCCVEVPGATLSYRLPTSFTGVALTWRAKRRAPPGGVRLKRGLVMLEVALPTTVSTTGDD